MNLTSPKEISAFLQENGLSPLKKFGQNFLCDENIVNKIADSTGAGAGDYVLEIGTGLGALSAALSRRVKRVVSVEIDRGLCSVHQATLAGFTNLTVIEDDILRLDLAALSREYFNGNGFYVCGNLPYYITSKILLHVLESGAPVRALTAMVQKEVAQRLCAQAGDADYGALTVSCNYYACPETLFTVSRNCFYPAPDVDSAIVRLDLSAPPFDVPRDCYTKIVRTSFSMRRKTIWNNLKQLASSELVARALQICGIDPKARAESLTPNDFCRLSKTFLRLKQECLQ